MRTDTVEPPAGALALPSVAAMRARWPVVLGGLLTAAMVAGVAHELFKAGLDGLGRTVPANPLFYLAFAIFYLLPPLCDYAIFRKLWGIPLDGLVALITKRIANDALFGYSGDAYFYAWARQRTETVSAPFGAVKDSAILSAIAGNAVTLGLTAIALPLGRRLLTPVQFSELGWSSIVIVGMSLPWLIFSRRVFSLPRPALWGVFAVHCLRLVAGSAALAVAWHLAMPDAALATWLLLVAGRLLVSRLPVVPNKDLLFANLAIALIGRGDAVSDLIAFTAALVLLVHIALLALFGLRALVRRRA